MLHALSHTREAQMRVNNRRNTARAAVIVALVMCTASVEGSPIGHPGSSRTMVLALDVAHPAGVGSLFDCRAGTQGR